MTAIDLAHEARFNAALATFVEGVKAIRADFYARMKDPNDRATFEIERGPKNVRVVRVDHGSRSVHCFVEIATGNVLKPAGWKAPVTKNPRGNIFAADNGLGGVTWCGVAYLR